MKLGFKRIISVLSVSILAKVALAAAFGTLIVVTVSETEMIRSISPIEENAEVPTDPRGTSAQSPAPSAEADLEAISVTKLLPDAPAASDQFGFSMDFDGDTAIVGAPGNENNKGAAYVFIRNGDTWTLQQKLTAPDGVADDNFGWDAAISGNTVVVGAFDLNENDAGAAYVFTRSGSLWTFQQKLTAAAGSITDQFAASVDIAGDDVIVGASGGDNSLGAAHIFRRNGVVWAEQQKLTVPGAATGSDIGWDVAISGSTAILGSPRSDNGAGAAYVFLYDGTTWASQQKLVPSSGSTLTQFGYSVDVDGDSVILGAVLDDSTANNAGAAYVFTRAASQWTLEQKLVNAAGAENDKFGTDVAIDGNSVVIGSNGRDANAIDGSGAAYVFTRTGTLWTLKQELLPTDAGEDDSFGGSVSVSGAVALVGSYLNDNQAPVGTVRDHGAAYAFTLQGSGTPTPTPTPAGVEVSGRILTDDGGGLRLAKVTLTDLNSGMSATIITASLGFFRFDNVMPGRSYRVSVTSKRFRFSSQTFELTQPRLDLEFVGVE